MVLYLAADGLFHPRTLPILAVPRQFYLRPPAMSQPPSSATSAATPLARALDQNEIVKDTVEQSANELFVINTVLKTELPNAVQAGEVAEALRKTDALETRIQESAEDLAEVNKVLEKEIGERADLERELANTKAALVRAKSETAD